MDTLIRDEKPHLVLMDLMLPGTDGIELMESVPELSRLPVIFLSASRTGPGDRPGAGSRR